MAIYPQTAVSQLPSLGVQGQLAYPDKPFDINSRFLETAMDPGLFVTQGSTDTFNGAKAPSAAGDITTAGKLQGVVMYQAGLEPASPNFAIKDCVGVLRKGYIWVLCDGDTTDGGPCFIVFQTNTLGAVRADAGAGTYAAAAPEGVRIHKGASAGGFCIVELNLYA